jgi:ligand-binding sensor domain-containing protein
MSKNHAYYPFYALLLALLMFTSCKGQHKTNLSKEVVNAKIAKTRNAYTNAAIGCALQDKQGNLWFGSNGEGVARYDGKIFSYFTMENGLNSNTVYSILEDKDGKIWVGTNKGLNLLNGKIFKPIPISITQSNNFNIFTANYHDSSKQNAVWSMMQDKSGTIWFGTDEGVFCHKFSEKESGITFSRFLDDSSIVNPNILQLKAIFAIFEDKNNNIWFGSCISEGISRFDGKRLTQVVPHKNVRRINNIMEDKSGNLWFATSFSGVGFYDGKTFTPNIFKQKEGYQSNIIEDQSGNIWFEKVGGLGCYDGKTEKTITIENGLPENNICPVLKDKEGNLWFSSVKMGLYRYDGKVFTNFSEKNTVIQNLIGN